MSKRMFLKTITAVAIMFVSLLVLVSAPVQAQAPGQARVVSRLGVAQVEGQRVFVHVWVVVPPGADANAVALAALGEQGARPFDSSKFTTTGMVWDQFFDLDMTNDSVIQNYNPTGDPTGGAGLTALINSHGTWNSVSLSRYVIDIGDSNISRCPSLVKECQGPQVFDGHNDVAWMDLTGCCTLGVTWYSTSVDEADMALNTKFPWYTDGGDYDVETVFLHENGHVAGLGHSDVVGAVMEPVYGGERRMLSTDDKDGIISLYPIDEEVSCASDVECDDGDACTMDVCTTDSVCSNVLDPDLGQRGDSCTSDDNCCSNRCRGREGAKTCK